MELALAAKRVGAMVIAINTRFRAREVQDILTRSEATHLAYWPGFHGIDFDAILADVETDAELIDARSLPELPDGDGDPDAPWMVFTSLGHDRRAEARRSHAARARRACAQPSPTPSATAPTTP